VGVVVSFLLGGILNVVLAQEVIVEEPKEVEALKVDFVNKRFVGLDGEKQNLSVLYGKLEHMTKQMDRLQDTCAR